MCLLLVFLLKNMSFYKKEAWKVCLGEYHRLIYLKNPNRSYTIHLFIICYKKEFKFITSV